MLVANMMARLVIHFILIANASGKTFALKQSKIALGST